MIPQFDADKPVGYNRRVMSIDRANLQINYDPSTSLLDGVFAETVQWLRDICAAAKWIQSARPIAA